MGRAAWRPGALVGSRELCWGHDRWRDAGDERAAGSLCRRRDFAFGVGVGNPDCHRRAVPIGGQHGGRRTIRLFSRPHAWHGNAVNATGFAYGAGFALATVALHGCGIGLAYMSQSVRLPVVRWAGAAIVVAGICLRGL